MAWKHPPQSEERQEEQHSETHVARDHERGREEGGHQQETAALEANRRSGNIPGHMRSRSELHGPAVVLLLHGHTFLARGRNRRLVRYSLGRAWEPCADISSERRQATRPLTAGQGARLMGSSRVLARPLRDEYTGGEAHACAFDSDLALPPYADFDPVRHETRERLAHGRQLRVRGTRGKRDLETGAGPGTPRVVGDRLGSVGRQAIGTAEQRAPTLRRRDDAREDGGRRPMASRRGLHAT